MKLEEAWRFFPHTFASKATGGRYKLYKHVCHMAEIIATEVAKGDARIIVQMPPRHGKSEFISFWLACWFLENWPDQRIILSSYAAKFAAKWGRKVRNEIESNKIFTQKIRQDSHAADRFDMERGGGMITAGVGGPITGEGANLFVIDDPVKNWEEAVSETIQERNIGWFDSTAYTRLEPGASAILLQTRWHERDLAGYLINEHEDDWKEIVFPAIAIDEDELGRKAGDPLCIERYNIEALQKIKKAVGPSVWNALYQQDPQSMKGNLWLAEWWQYYDEPPEKFDEMVQSWDLTFKDGKDTDYVVGQVWGRKGVHKYLLDQVRGQLSFTKTEYAILEMSRRWPKAFTKLIENKANGPAIENTLKNKITGIRLVEPQGSKMARASACEPQLASGHVHIPNPAQHSWVRDYLAECSAFPKGKTDDQVDTTSQALLFFSKRENSILSKINRR